VYVCGDRWVGGGGGDLDRGVAMAEIGGHSHNVGNIVQSQLRNIGLHLQQQCQWLSDTASSSCRRTGLYFGSQPLYNSTFVTLHIVTLDIVTLDIVTLHIASLLPVKTSLV
jgi:hypothetical protein